MSDLFDGVKPPREDRREAPQAAAAPAPAREAAPGEKGKPQGVPVARLWLWMVPLLLAVAAVALWSVSVWLLVAAAVAAVLGAIVSALLWWWQRHRRPGTGRTARARSWTPTPSGRSGQGGRSGGRTGRGGLFSRGGVRGRGSGGRTGASTAPSGRRTGSRWSPFNGASRRGGKTAGRAGGGQAARADGGGSRAGRSRGLRSLLPGRRGGGTTSGSAAKGRGSSRTGGSRRSGAGSPRSAAGVPAGWWSRSRANPATWLGPQGASARAARKSARRRKEQSKTDKEAPASTKRTEKGTGTESGKRRWWPRRRKKATAKDTEKPKASDDTVVTADAVAKPAEAPKPQKTAKQPAPTNPVRVPHRKTGTKAAPKQAETAVEDDVLVFNEMGFPTRPNPGPRRPPTEFHQPNPTTIKAPKATKGSNAMSDRASNPYAHLIDSSTTASFRASTGEAAKQARADAAKLEADAAELKRQAQSWIEKGASETAEPLQREAAALEADATNRRAAAAAYESV